MDEVYDNSNDDLKTDCSGGANCYDIANGLLEDSVSSDSKVLYFTDDTGILNILAIAYHDGVQDGTSNYYLIKISK